MLLGKTVMNIPDVITITEAQTFVLEKEILKNSIFQLQLIRKKNKQTIGSKELVKLLKSSNIFPSLTPESGGVFSNIFTIACVAQAFWITLSSQNPNKEYFYQISVLKLIRLKFIQNIQQTIKTMRVTPTC